MVLDVRGRILAYLGKHREVRAADMVKETGLSRVYVNRFFRILRDEGKIVLIGKANRAHYVLARSPGAAQAKSGPRAIARVFSNKNLSEDIVLEGILRTTSIFFHVPANVLSIVEYAFTEMLNNAIEHSRSKNIKITMERDRARLRFTVIDQGIGIFNNIMQKKKLDTELAAIQDLLKGKQTTAPKRHTGEGIFFTSKAADTLVIQSSKKKLIFNTVLDDVFIEDSVYMRGTKVVGTISLASKRRLDAVFKEYSGNSYEFEKTKVVVRLYKIDSRYISRSQARRVISGLEKFKTIVLDFKNVDTVGQAFADEVFRVWQVRHLDIRILSKNANENILFMVNRALGTSPRK